MSFSLGQTKLIVINSMSQHPHPRPHPSILLTNPIMYKQKKVHQTRRDKTNICTYLTSYQALSFYLCLSPHSDDLFYSNIRRIMEKTKARTKLTASRNHSLHQFRCVSSDNKVSRTKIHKLHTIDSDNIVIRLYTIVSVYTLIISSKF